MVWTQHNVCHFFPQHYVYEKKKDVNFVTLWIRNVCEDVYSILQFETYCEKRFTFSGYTGYTTQYRVNVSWYSILITAVVPMLKKLILSLILCPMVSYALSRFVSKIRTRQMMLFVKQMPLSSTSLVKVYLHNREQEKCGACQKISSFYLFFRGLVIWLGLKAVWTLWKK